MAGGVRALVAPSKPTRIRENSACARIRKKRPGKKDVVIGIAAGGRTPFTVAAVEYARKAGAKTIALTCNPDSPLEKAAELARSLVETGPEVVSGSTRGMKAGTAEKLVLNMLSTGAMVKLGYVYGNLMVNLHQKNTKLTERAVTIVARALGTDRDKAREALQRAGRDVPIAIVMAKAGDSRVSAEQSQEILKVTFGGRSLWRRRRKPKAKGRGAPEALRPSQSMLRRTEDPQR